MLEKGWGSARGTAVNDLPGIRGQIKSMPRVSLPSQAPCADVGALPSLVGPWLLLSGLFLHWNTTNPLCYGAQTRIRVAAFRKTNLSSSRRAASAGRSTILSGAALRGQTKPLSCGSCFQRLSAGRDAGESGFFFFYLSVRNSQKLTQMPPGWDESGMKHPEGVGVPV